MLDGVDELFLVRFRVDSAVVGDCGLLLAFRADLNDLIRLIRVQQVDDLILDICENNLVTGVVEELRKSVYEKK